LINEKEKQETTSMAPLSESISDEKISEEDEKGKLKGRLRNYQTHRIRPPSTTEAENPPPVADIAQDENIGDSDTEIEDQKEQKEKEKEQKEKEKEKEKEKKEKEKEHPSKGKIEKKKSR